MVNYSITYKGLALNRNKYKINFNSKTLSCEISDLVIDFSPHNGWTFNIESDCTIKTGHSCTFNTRSNCTFDTGHECTFNTGWNCNFKTGERCNFHAGRHCIFKTGWNCIFGTRDYCTFNTGAYCTFDTNGNCTFKTGIYCTFNTGECCCFLIHNFNTQKFKTYDDISVIVDMVDDKRYLLTKDLIKLTKIIYG